jgi:sigma-E factor negative regulatory protein RseC
VIGVPESGLLRGSLAVYAAPLAGLFAGALTGYSLSAGASQGYVDLVTMLLGAAGFAVALLWLRRFSRASARDRRYQPVTLRRALPVGAQRQGIF